MTKQHKLHLKDSANWERKNKSKQKRYTYKSHCKHFILDMATVKECYKLLRLIKKQISNLKGDK